jgi:formylglycine-generating enzyme required for sulfatase activity
MMPRWKATWGKGIQMLLVRALVVFAVLLSFGSAAQAVTIDWTPVGNPGNACDTQSQGCFGAVGHDYQIGTYEVTNAQYAEFLNAKAASDPLGLYNTAMGGGFGGITQSGVSGSFTYSAISGRANLPVSFVSFYDALRFANWLNNGQGSGATETGAYTLLGGTATPSNGTTVTRNPGATIVLTSEDEWYKAAYYSALGTSYFDYPAGSDTQTTCATPTATANRANCNSVFGDLTIAGSYTGSASPYGTFDQGGNVWEWNEAIASGSLRGVRGGSFLGPAGGLAASAGNFNGPTFEVNNIGFRVGMMVPEPGTGLLVMLGMLGLAFRHRPHA